MKRSVGVCPQAIRAGLACLVCAVGAAGAEAAPFPCEDPAAAPRLLMGVQRGEAAELSRAGGAESRISRSMIDWRGGGTEDGGIGLGFGHEYSIYDITPFFPPRQSSPEPSANGHLHVLYAAADLSPLLADGWELRLQPALAVSSNFLKEPGAIGREALQLNAALFRRLGAEAAGWRVGLCADHRFGDYRVYPAVSWHWEGDSWSLRLGWPDSRLSRRLGAGLETSLSLSPAGDRWRVHDEGIGDSRFVHEAWELQWRLDWRLQRQWTLRLQAASLLDSEYVFTLDTGERYIGGTPSPLQLGLSLLWHYSE